VKALIMRGTTSTDRNEKKRESIVAAVRVNNKIPCWVAKARPGGYMHGEPLNAFRDGILEEIPALQLWEKQYLCTPRAYILILLA
jgi:hypothetical protein